MGKIIIRNEEECRAGLIDGFGTLHGHYIFALEEGWNYSPILQAEKLRHGVNKDYGY